MEKKYLLRAVTFRPYAPGAGPVFYLRMWTANEAEQGGRGTKLSYVLKQSHGPVIFEGRDWSGSSLDDNNSDECVRALMSFLCLRPGDSGVQAAHFAHYTPAQLDFCATHAEALSADVEARFPETRPRRR